MVGEILTLQGFKLILESPVLPELADNKVLGVHPAHRGMEPLVAKELKVLVLELEHKDMVDSEPKFHKVHKVHKEHMVLIKVVSILVDKVKARGDLAKALKVDLLGVQDSKVAKVLVDNREPKDMEQAG